MTSKVKYSFLLVFLVSLILLSGCIFSPERKDAVPPPDSVKYLDPISPGNVLQNLIDAYVARDSVGTAAVYADGYVGETIDPSEPASIPQFSKTDEVRHVGRLRLDPNIVSVSLNLGAPGSWQVLEGSGDHPEWVIIQITNQTVQIEDLSRNTTFESKNQIIEYKFEPTAAPGEPAERDTTWKVVRWTETAN